MLHAGRHWKNSIIETRKCEGTTHFTVTRKSYRFTKIGTLEIGVDLEFDAEAIVVLIIDHGAYHEAHIRVRIIVTVLFWKRSSKNKNIIKFVQLLTSDVINHVVKRFQIGILIEGTVAGILDDIQ